MSRNQEPVLVAPSLLAADFLHLDSEIRMINGSEADWFHLDIMDGVFVPNLSFGFPVVEKISEAAQKPLDVHLMIIDPDRYIHRFREAGASVISVHYETCPHLHRTLDFIKKTGARAGVVLNPHSPVSLLGEVIREADLVLIMSVNPGFGGQKFIESTYEKLTELRELCAKKNATPLIQVDGGVDLSNAGALVKAGAGILVAGNAIFRSREPLSVIRRMKNLHV
ncbi:MAG TPA: ribulose-phosphate 3-epimerase [Bacteroidales bacterium]|nr:ribulose-phosphate 3-epimerase [Bacteroidales bacterium]HPT09312.1 ribulose-phosphate 3-epimerase [Bacteroidales bacterium]